MAMQERNDFLHLFSSSPTHNPVTSIHVLRLLTKCLVIDEAAPCASAHDETHIRDHVYQKLPPFPIRHKVGGSCYNSGDVGAGHGM